MKFHHSLISFIKYFNHLRYDDCLLSYPQTTMEISTQNKMIRLPSDKDFKNIMENIKPLFDKNKKIFKKNNNNTTQQKHKHTYTQKQRQSQALPLTLF